MNSTLASPIDSIPHELQAVDQWVVAGPDKRPYNPITMHLASVTDASTWSTYAQAKKAASERGPDWGIGLVLTQGLGITVIDQDDKSERPLTDEQRARQLSMRNTFNSYTERSRSGTGYHIVLRGKIPSGVKRDGIEIYSSDRYIIFTGNVVNNSPISSIYQTHLENMYTQMKGVTGQVALVEGDDDFSWSDDRDLVEKAMAASNADKFNDLCNGNTTGYPSQSEADMALLSILAFWTTDNAQVRRIFRLSMLGKRDKHVKSDYHIDLCLRKIRANVLPAIDMSAVKLKSDEIIAKAMYENPVQIEADDSKKEAAPPGKFNLPPGLMGALTQYFLSSVNRPVMEVALHASIALMATLCGRSYCTYGMPTGLNMYLILVAKTGTGKEDGKRGILRLLNFVKPRIPMVHNYICTGMFASGQALHKHFEKQPSFLWVNAEIGHYLKRFMSPKAASADLAMQRTMLDIYSQSGPDGLLGSHIHSDSEKNSIPVRSPSMTLMGETTPEVFYGCLDDADISNGLIPRMLVVEYRGVRPPMNNCAGHPPSSNLIDDVCRLTEQSIRLEASSKFLTVQPDEHATELLNKFNEECDEKINASYSANSQSSVTEVWNRAHLHAVKLASLVAVGINPLQPVIDAVSAQWAIDFIRYSVNNVLSKFETGEAGGNTALKAETEIRRKIMQFLAANPAKRSKLEGVSAAFQTGNLIPYNYLSRNLKKLQPFKSNSKLLKEMLDEMARGGQLTKLSSGDPAHNGSRGEIYVVSDGW